MLATNWIVESYVQFAKNARSYSVMRWPKVTNAKSLRENEPKLFTLTRYFFFGGGITTFIGYEDMLLATRHQLFQKGTMEVWVLPLQISFPVTISHHNQKNTSHSTHGFHSAFKWQVFVYLLYHCFLSAFSGSQPIKNHITISLYYLCMIGKKCHWQYKYNKNEKSLLGWIIVCWVSEVRLAIRSIYKNDHPLMKVVVCR